jgi:hypothetical protein
MAFSAEGWVRLALERFCAPLPSMRGALRLFDVPALSLRKPCFWLAHRKCQPALRSDNADDVELKNPHTPTRVLRSSLKL